MPNMSSKIERTAIALAKAALYSPVLDGSTQGAAQKLASSKQRKPRISTGKAMLIGAGLTVAGQVLVKTRGRDALDMARHGIAEMIDSAAGEDEQDFEDDEDYGDAPHAYEDEDYDDEDEPEDLEDDEEYDEPEDIEDDEPEHEVDEEEQPTARPRRKAAR